MVWLALKARGYAPWAAGADAVPAPRDRVFLTLEIDPSRLADAGGPLVHVSDPAAKSVLNLSYLGRGGIGLLHRRGEARLALAVSADLDMTAGPWRLTLDSDPARGDSALVLEDLGRGTVRQQRQALRIGFTSDEVRSLFAGRAAGGAVLHPAVEWFALGTGVPLVGIGSGYAPETGIVTTNGARPAGSLRPGDKVQTEAGPRPVIWTRQVEMPGVGAFRPVRLLSPYFGAGDDIIVPARQLVALRGADVDYLFDSPEVLVEARHLVDGVSGLWEPATPVRTWSVLLLAHHHLLGIGACSGESLYLGSLGTDHEIARRTAFGQLLSGNGLPVQKRLSGRVLEPWEARALVEARARGRAPVSG